MKLTTKQIWAVRIGIMLALSIFFFAVISPIISATAYYKQNTIIDLKEQCINNGTYCSGSAYCNITVVYPNNSLFVNNQQMTNNVYVYNYTLSDSSTLGVYKCSTTCCDAGLCGTDSSCDFIINGIGSEISSAQSILYIILLAGILIVLMLTIWGAIIFPWGNIRTDEGEFIGINDLKYVKIILWVFVYLEVLFGALIFKNLSQGYLALEGTFSFFNIIYTVLLVGLLPFFPLLIFFTIVIWLKDKTTLKNLSRGLPA